MKHVAYALEAILQKELKESLAKEREDRGSLDLDAHIYAQGYLSAVRRMKEILLKQKDKQHDTTTTFRFSQ